MGLVLSSIWTLARLKVQCQESSAAGSLGGPLTEMGKRCHGHREALVNNKQTPLPAEAVLRKEGGEQNTRHFLFLPPASRSHIPHHRLRDSSPLYIKAHHPHSLVSLF